MVGQLETLLDDDDTVVFRVCHPDTLDCNESPQPFATCDDEFFSMGLQRQVKTRWSANGLPAERRTGYAMVFLTMEAEQVVMEWPLRYRFTGSPISEVGQVPGVLGGVSEVSDDAATLRVVVPKQGGPETRGSAILIGERNLGD